MSLTATPETPVPSPSPPIVEQMAVAKYHKILIFQSQNPSSLWPNQYVSINGYQVVLPREEHVLVADQILRELNEASEGYEHEIYDPTNPDRLMTVRKRRMDLNYRMVEGGISPFEADRLRNEVPATIKVFPAKLTVAAKAALSDLEKKKGK